MDVTLGRVMMSIIVFGFFYYFSLFFGKFLYKVIRSRTQDYVLAELVSKIVRISIVVCAFISSLGTFGIDVTGLVAGLGLSSFALGLSLKDIISNSMSDFLLILYRPFEIGDEIQVQNFRGKVVEINLRYTILDTEKKEKLSIPSSIVFHNAVAVVKKHR